jgi:hypothetical protein
VVVVERGSRKWVNQEDALSCFVPTQFKATQLVVAMAVWAT